MSETTHLPEDHGEAQAPDSEIERADDAPPVVNPEDLTEDDAGGEDDADSTSGGEEPATEKVTDSAVTFR